MSSISALSRAFFQSLKPPAKLTLSEWADRYAVLSAESSAEAGRWKTLPYQKGIMDAFTDPLVEQITVIKSARVGYTKILNHAMAYHIHQDPCSIMMVQPTIEDAEGYSKEEIAPMLRDTPCLAGLVTDAKAKDGSNTLLTKLFPGGTLGIIGANSPRGFRRVSRRIVLFDETDGYPASAGTEGDQIKLGIKRTDYFWNRKIVAGSTPTIKDASRIERLFGQSDQRRYFVPCPQCHHMQYLKWPNLKWPKDEPEKAYFVCEANGCAIEHSEKRWMIERGEWRAQTPGTGKHVGFHIWAAYSYSPNATWGNLAAEFLEAKGNPESLKTFINTALGEVWEEDYSAKLGADGLRGRAEFYEPNVVPRKCVIVTQGVDVQDNRIEITRYGWAKGEEAWTISHTVIFGDPAKPEIYKQLDEIVLQPIRREGGGEMLPTATAVDTGGHHTHQVYQYVRERMRHGSIIGVKGQSQRNKPAIGKPTKVDLNIRGQFLRGGAEVYPMGSDTIKSVLYGRLKIVEPGPGYIHFHTDLGPEFFEQLTAERQTTRYVKGFAVREWVKKSGARNEALDCLVMAYAALQWLYTRYRRESIFDQFERKLAANLSQNKPDPSADKTELEVPSQPEKDNRQFKPARSTIRPRSRGGFVKGW